MQMFTKLAFDSSPEAQAIAARDALVKRYGQCPKDKAEAIVALGGDGFMLQTLRGSYELNLPVYGMNCGTVGFLMNAYSPDNLPQRLAQAEMALLNPLRMTAITTGPEERSALAINEVALLRAGPQAARLRILVDGMTRLEELVGDGALVATPAGSTAYNYSAHGPILPIGSDVLALTAVAAFRPRRWRGALLPCSAKVVFKVCDPEKRPVTAEADGQAVRHVTRVEVVSESAIAHRLLFDQGHGLDERLLRTQFE